MEVCMKVIYLFLLFIVTTHASAMVGCVTEFAGNASAHCVCENRGGHYVAQSTGDNCLPDHPGYEHHGSVEACLEAFSKACESGRFIKMTKDFKQSLINE